MTYRENCNGCTERDEAIAKLRAEAATLKPRREWIEFASRDFDFQHGVAWILMFAAFVALAAAFVVRGSGDPLVRRGAVLLLALLVAFRWVMTREVQR